MSPMFSVITPPMSESKARTIRVDTLSAGAHACGLRTGYRIDHVEIIPEHDGDGRVQLDVQVVGRDDAANTGDDILAIRREAEQAIFKALEED